VPENLVWLDLRLYYVADYTDLCHVLKMQIFLTRDHFEKATPNNQKECQNRGGVGSANSGARRPASFHTGNNISV